MIKATRIFFLCALVVSFCLSVFFYFTSEHRRIPRVLLYHHLVNDRVQGVRLGFPRHGLNSARSVTDLVSVALRRPPVVFFRPLFAGTAELQGVQTSQRQVFISLTVKDSSKIEKTDLEMLKKIVSINFPIFDEVQIFINGRQTETP